MKPGEQYDEYDPVWQRRKLKHIIGVRWKRLRPGAKQKRELRARLLREQNYQCAYCGRSITEETATIDHLIPFSRGGTNTIRNTVASCLICNVKKGDQSA